MEQKIQDKIEKELNFLAQTYNQYLLQSIPDKQAFFSELSDKIQKEKNTPATLLWNWKLKKYTKPLSSFWEQLIYSKLNFIFAFMLFFFMFSFSYLLFVKKESHFGTKEEKIPFGSSLPKLEQEKNMNSHKNNLEEIENQMLEKIYKEEDPEKKQKLIQELLEFYKNTNQIDKLQEIYENLE